MNAVKGLVVKAVAGRDSGRFFVILGKKINTVLSQTEKAVSFLLRSEKA